MRINFDSGATAVVARESSPVADAVDKMYRHLQHVRLTPRAWDNPKLKLDVKSLLYQTGKAVGIEVDRSKLSNQSYLNHLHQLYEAGFDGSAKWLDFHECIHNVENITVRPCAVIDYREKAGLLTKPFDFDWYSLVQTQVPAGAVYTEWCELGKIPYNYYRDSEPDDLERLCELAKPWITLQPKLCIALEPIDFLSGRSSTGFASWWTKYEQDWCKHWGLKTHSLHNQFGVIVVGKVNARQVDDLLSNGDTISRVVLQ